MAEMRESSVLFSLNQLMNLEQQRIREEEEAARKRAEAESIVRMEIERRKREEQQARLHAEENRRRAEEAQRREMEARLEAIRVAELEKVRIDAEQKVRIALLEQANEHERKLAALTQDEQKRRLKRILIYGGAFMAALFATGGGVYFGHLKPEAERIHKLELADLAALDADMAKLKAEYEQAVAKAEKAAQSLAQAKDEVGRIKALEAADDAKKAADDAKKKFARGSGSTVKKDDPCDKCSDPHDPLCGCLKFNK
jgi:colicin import membrane protein